MSDELKTDKPSYLRLLKTGELKRRVEALETLLERCTVCPRDCLNNRSNNEIAACYSGRLPIVSSYTPHFGEEPPLTGTRGAGNIFSAIAICAVSIARTIRFRRRIKSKLRMKSRMNDWLR